ncbi:MAG: hypothetical protein RIR70_496 [Pseudomonadota bacterium]|jgi:hypothetical protein
MSTLPHTWLIDLDGTVLAHNGHLNGGDSVLPGVLEFWTKIPEQDVIILLSARHERYREHTLAFLSAQGLRFDGALFGLPTGERILINDRKNSGLPTALAVNLARDAGPGEIHFKMDGSL